MYNSINHDVVLHLCVHLVSKIPFQTLEVSGLERVGLRLINAVFDLDLELLVFKLCNVRNKSSHTVDVNSNWIRIEGDLQYSLELCRRGADIDFVVKHKGPFPRTWNAAYNIPSTNLCSQFDDLCTVQNVLTAVDDRIVRKRLINFIEKYEQGTISLVR